MAAASSSRAASFARTPPPWLSQQALVSAPDGIKENNIVVDIKLAIMFLSCLVGCVAQFYPMPFPDNRILLAACFFLYFALSAAYQYYLWFIERDYIFATKEVRHELDRTSFRLAETSDTPLRLVRMTRHSLIARVEETAGCPPYSLFAPATAERFLPSRCYLVLQAAGRPSVSVRTNLPRSEDKIVADNEKLDKYGVIVECPKGKEVLSTAVSVGRFFTKVSSLAVHVHSSAGFASWPSTSAALPEPLECVFSTLICCRRANSTKRASRPS